MSVMRFFLGSMFFAREAAEVVPAPVCFAGRALPRSNVRRRSDLVRNSCVSARRPQVNHVAFKLCMVFITSLYLHTALRQRGSTTFHSTQQCKFSPFYSSRLVSLWAQCFVLSTEGVVGILVPLQLEHISDYQL